MDLTNAYFEALEMAHIHAKNHSHCAHLATSVLVDGRYTGITATNLPGTHSEIHALEEYFAMTILEQKSTTTLTTENEYFEKDCRPQQVSRLRDSLWNGSFQGRPCNSPCA